MKRYLDKDRLNRAFLVQVLPVLKGRHNLLTDIPLLRSDRTTLKEPFALSWVLLAGMLGSTYFDIHAVLLGYYGDNIRFVHSDGRKTTFQ